MKTKKENLILLVGMIIVLGTQLVGCKKVPIPPIVVEPELKPQIELTVTPNGVIPWGDTIMLEVKTSNAKYLWVNGEKQASALESALRVGLYNDTIFVFKAKNITLVSEKELEVKVGHWSKSLLGLVASHGWKQISLKAWRGDTLLATFDLLEEQKTNLCKFNPGGKYEVYTKDGKLIGENVWFLDKDKKQIIIGKIVPEILDIIQVDENKLIVRKTTPYVDGLPCQLESVYMNPSS